MNAPKIRIVTRADLPAILALYAQPSFNGAALAPADAEEIFERMARYPFYRLYLAEIEGRVLGTLALLIMDNIAREGTPSAIVEGVVVAEGVRGQGIGQALMRFAFRTARASGAYKIMLSTSSQDPAVHDFYQGMDYIRHGVSYRLEPLADSDRPE